MKTECISVFSSGEGRDQALELAEKIPLYEPRADIISVTCTVNLAGELTAVIRIGPNADYYSSEEEPAGGGYFEGSEDEDY